MSKICQRSVKDVLPFRLFSLYNGVYTLSIITEHRKLYYLYGFLRCYWYVGLLLLYVHLVLYRGLLRFQRLVRL